MTLAVHLPLLLPVLVAVAARYATDHARPRTAGPGLVVAAVLTAAASIWPPPQPISSASSAPG
jgi:hypothetical protein